MTIVHHIIAIASGFYLVWILPDYPDHLYRLVWWLVMAEITSIFNNLRVLTRKTACSFHTSILFAIVFITVRSFMTYGSVMEVLYNEHNYIHNIIVYGLAVLNITWMFMIVKLIRKEYAHLKKGLDGETDGKSINDMLKDHTKRD